MRLKISTASDSDPDFEISKSRFHLTSGIADGGSEAHRTPIAKHRGVIGCGVRADPHARPVAFADEKSTGQSRVLAGFVLRSLRLKASVGIELKKIGYVIEAPGAECGPNISLVALASRSGRQFKIATVHTKSEFSVPYPMTSLLNLFVRYGEKESMVARYTNRAATMP